jgi:hypothetical protein
LPRQRRAKMADILMVFAMAAAFAGPLAVLMVSRG